MDHHWRNRCDQHDISESRLGLHGTCQSAWVRNSQGDRTTDVIPITWEKERMFRGRSRDREPEELWGARTTGYWGHNLESLVVASIMAVRLRLFGRSHRSGGGTARLNKRQGKSLRAWRLHSVFPRSLKIIRTGLPAELIVLTLGHVGMECYREKLDCQNIINGKQWTELRWPSFARHPINGFFLSRSFPTESRKIIGIEKSSNWNAART